MPFNEPEEIPYKAELDRVTKMLCRAMEIVSSTFTDEQYNKIIDPDMRQWWAHYKREEALRKLREVDRIRKEDEQIQREINILVDRRLALYRQSK
jgi:hypothetical protein